MIQCNSSAMRVTGPAGLALIAGEPAARIEQVFEYVVQHMLKHSNDVKPQCVIVKNAVYVIL